MGLDNIRKKSQSLGKSKSSVVTITDMFANPQMALDLIAHICTDSRDLDVDHCFDDFENILDELGDIIKEKEYNLFKKDLLSSCKSIANDLVISLLTDVSANLKIAVAGGFSAGKSSLLNALTGIGNLLPTGIEPTSMVKTNLNCSTSCNNLIVRGENIKGDVVRLNKDVLACVQHENTKSNVYVASVLNRIIMDVPTLKAAYLDGVTFIDTPGYDNSHDTNKENKKKDIDTALEAINEADVLFWCIDIEKGTIPNNDLQMLKRIQQTNEVMPIVLFFTKMDKKAEKEVDIIMKSGSKLCKKELKNMPIDTIGVSCDNGVSMKLLNNRSIEEVFKKIRTTTGTPDYLKRAESQIQSWFEDEITVSNNTTDKYEKDRTESVKQKQEWQQLYYSQKNNNKEEIGHIKEVLLSSYDKIMEAADKSRDAYYEARKGWSDALNREVEWSDKAKWYADTSSLFEQNSNSVDDYNRMINLDLNYKYWTREHREDLCERIKKLLDDTLEEINNYREKEEERTRSLVSIIQNEAELRTLIGKYQPIVLETLSHCYNACKTLIIDHMNKLQQPSKEEDSDVFSAIHADNYKRFLACFSNGVDMCKYDAEGYSPLTLACKMGNNEMVKFFIDNIGNNVDLSCKDGRGYNALETATIYNYRDICELLYKADKTLVSKSGNLVELSRQNSFTDWISKL